MEPLVIKPTAKSPAIELKEGELKFSGCSIINDPKTFFIPVINWLEKYVANPPNFTIVNVQLEYIDTASAKSFFDILKTLEKISRNNKLEVNWHYDENDPEILELGEIIQSRVKIEFNYIEKN